MVTREVFWAVPIKLQYYFYGAAFLAVIVSALGIWSRISIWTAGVDDKEFAGFRTRDFIFLAIKGFFSKNCIFAKKSFQLATYRGVMLLFIIWGFSTLFLSTVLLSIHHHITPFLSGRIYYIYSFASDIAGLLLLIGLAIAIARRHIVREVRKLTSREDFFFLYLFLGIAITGFLAEGMRLASLRPPYLDFAEGGVLAAEIIKTFGLYRIINYTMVWTVHTSLVLLLIAYLPFSKFFHILAAQVSVMVAERRYGGAIGGR